MLNFRSLKMQQYISFTTSNDVDIIGACKELGTFIKNIVILMYFSMYPFITRLKRSHDRAINGGFIVNKKMMCIVMLAPCMHDLVYHGLSSSKPS